MNVPPLQTMDFFTAQEQARRRTVWLVLLFVFTIVAITAGIYFVLLAAFASAAEKPLPSLWHPTAATISALFVLTVVGISSLVKIAQLRQGGAHVAMAVGAVPYNAAGTDPVRTRQLKNIVEEMAIASGCPQPDVFVLPNEDGINAFAAGWTPDNAAIAVTNGSLRYLTRDELQGVIAHEFSHILYGDMRVNCRMLAIITGLFAISVIGRILIEVGIRLAGAPSRLGAKKKGGNPAPFLIILGAVLWVLGLIGVLCGRIIQAAISRQREYLADASAVQFTRNPDGIAGALKKIGGLGLHGRVQHPRASELAHMFFADFRRYFVGLFATHPPLEERIRRIDPTFDGHFPTVHELAPEPAPAAAMAAAPVAPAVPVSEEQLNRHWAEERAGEADPSFAAKSDVWLGRIARPDTSDFAYARTLLSALPPALVEATREPMPAMALIYALLIDPNPTVRQRQLEYLRSHLPQAIYEETTRFYNELRNVGREAWLPLAQLTVPSIGTQPPDQCELFAKHVQALIAEDGKLSLFEFCIAHSVLMPLLDRSSPRRRSRLSTRQATPHLLVVVAVLARLGHVDSDQEEQAFRTAIESTLPPKLRPATAALPPKEQCTLIQLDRSLKALRYANLEARKLALEAAVRCVVYDGRVTLSEAELLRTIASSLGLPVPPVVQRLRSSTPTAPPKS